MTRVRRAGPGEHVDVELALLRRQVRVAVEEEPEEELRYRVDDGLGDVALAEEVEVPLTPTGVSPLRADALRTRIDLHEANGAVRQVGGEAARGRRSLVVTYDEELLVAQVIHERLGVSGHRRESIGGRVGDTL